MNKIQLLNSLKQYNFPKEVLDAFSKVKRENFIPKELKFQAYEDNSLPIGEGQTISQPYTIARMLELLELKKNQKVLEIGSGSGYVLALISEITKTEVYGIEVIEKISKTSIENLREFPRIKVYNKNGKNGLIKHAPYDKILISAAIKKIPKQILNQLNNGGILVAPIDEKDKSQSLIKLKREKNKFIILKKIPGFVFVRFI